MALPRGRDSPTTNHQLDPPHPPPLYHHSGTTHTPTPTLLLAIGAGFALGCPAERFFGHPISGWWACPPTCLRAQQHPPAAPPHPVGGGRCVLAPEFACETVIPAWLVANARCCTARVGHARKLAPGCMPCVVAAHGTRAPWHWRVPGPRGIFTGTTGTARRPRHSLSAPSDGVVGAASSRTLAVRCMHCMCVPARRLPDTVFVCVPTQKSVTLCVCGVALAGTSRWCARNLEKRSENVLTLHYNYCFISSFFMAIAQN